jgi:pimeloyl-ACP methyl ester carboxylesterase
MNKSYRLFVVPLLATLMLMLGACERPAPSAPAAPQATSADGVPIRYEVSGSGEPVLVFVHCWTCDRSFWDAQAAHFANRYLVVRLDLAGHGASGTGRKNYTVEAFGADVAAVVDVLALKQVVLIGHSMGGLASVVAADLLGERVIGVVGVDIFRAQAKYPRNQQKIDDMIEKFENDFADTMGQYIRGGFGKNADPELINRIAGNAVKADRDMALSAGRHVFAWLRDKAPDVPTRLGRKLHNINGNRMSGNPPSYPDVTWIDDAGHYVPQEKPAEFNRALEEIVKGFAATTSAKP